MVHNRVSDAGAQLELNDKDAFEACKAAVEYCEGDEGTGSENCKSALPARHDLGPSKDQRLFFVNVAPAMNNTMTEIVASLLRTTCDVSECPVFYNHMHYVEQPEDLAYVKRDE